MLRWLGLAALLYGAAYYIVSRLIYQPARLLSLDLGPLAPNVMLQPHAPLSDILPIADALVLNGNSESVLAALQAGLPAVVLPSIWDQAEMAWRVAETGAGLRISPWRATPERVRRAVIRVLDEPSFRDNAAKMGAGLARGGGPARAAALIGDLEPGPARLAAAVGPDSGRQD